MPAPSVDAISAALIDSRIVAAGGYLVMGLLRDSGLEALAKEAFRQHEYATTARVTDADAMDGTAGNPNRWLESAPSGPVLDAFYHAASVRRVLREVSGVLWQPSGGSGAYSYYRGENHHLGLHRDIDECDLAVITCVHEMRETDAPSGDLVLYSSRQSDSLEQIERSPESGAVKLRLSPGESLMLLGGLVPHRVAPLVAGHVRIVAPLCFRATGVAGPNFLSACSGR